jgi:hypothetical protein
VTSPAPAHRTVSLHEWHLVGPDGLPVRHRTLHVLRALRPGLRSYTYRCDSRDARVRAIRGASAGQPYPDVEGLTAVDLALLRPLAVGETAALKYETLFDWTSIPPPYVRRGMRLRVERVDMRVEFSSQRLPARLEWVVWDGFGPDARIRAAEEVVLDREHAAHRFLDVADGVTVGFTWTWAPGQEPVLPVR